MKILESIINSFKGEDTPKMKYGKMIVKAINNEQFKIISKSMLYSISGYQKDRELDYKDGAVHFIEVFGNRIGYLRKIDRYNSILVKINGEYHGCYLSLHNDYIYLWDLGIAKALNRSVKDSQMIKDIERTRILAIKEAEDNKYYDLIKEALDLNPLDPDLQKKMEDVKEMKRLWKEANKIIKKAEYIRDRNRDNPFLT